jgi:hypothetical protein
MAEPRTIERHGAILLRSLVDDPADKQVLGHGAVTVQKHDRPSRSSLDVMKAHSASGNEPPPWRILQLGPPRLPVGDEGGPGHGHAGQRHQTSAPRPSRR